MNLTSLLFVHISKTNAYGHLPTVTTTTDGYASVEKLYWFGIHIYQHLQTYQKIYQYLQEKNLSSRAWLQGEGEDMKKHMEHGTDTEVRCN